MIHPRVRCAVDASGVRQRSRRRLHRCAQVGQGTRCTVGRTNVRHGRYGRPPRCAEVGQGTRCALGRENVLSRRIVRRSDRPVRYPSVGQGQRRAMGSQNLATRMDREKRGAYRLAQTEWSAQAFRPAPPLLKGSEIVTNVLLQYSRCVNIKVVKLKKALYEEPKVCSTLKWICGSGICLVYYSCS